jgi:hypothetical protein
MMVPEIAPPPCCACIGAKLHAATKKVKPAAKARARGVLTHFM